MKKGKFIMTKTVNEKIEMYDDKIKQYRNKKKQLVQKNKADERKARNRRLFSRAALLESMLPETIELTDEQFEAFLKMTTANDFGRDKLNQIKSQVSTQPKSEPPQSGES